ncbi:MAG: hypothetical protein NVSMB46_03040 [Candidatus Saccharimonadales bacterium]
MSSTKPHQRLFALLGAILFFATSIALTVAVLWQMHQDSKQNAANDVQQTAQAAAKQDPSANQNKGAKLQGTKLNDFTPTSSIDKLQIIDTKPGTGAEVKPNDKVTAHYTGAVAATGIIFQSSHDSGQPVTFPLNQVIKGWQDGVPGMKVGGTRRLLIPSASAYGANPPGGSGIPANADLVFDIELTAIQQ